MPESANWQRLKLTLLGTALAAGLAAAVWCDPGSLTTDQAEVAGESVSVSAHAAGRVAALPVSEGQAVAAGTLIARLDDREPRAAVVRAAAGLARARAEARAAREGLAWQGAQLRSQADQAGQAVETARASLAAARARSDEAQQALANLTLALERNVVQPQHVDVARTTARTREAELASAVAQLRASEEAARLARAGARGPIATPGEAGAEARIEQAQAELLLARLNVEGAEVRAPVQGVIARRLVAVGEQVVPGQPIATLLAPEGMWVWAYVRELDLARVREGAGAQVRLDAYPGEVFAGKVALVGAMASSTAGASPMPAQPFVRGTRMVPVKVTVADPHHRLRPGLSAVVSFDR